MSRTLLILALCAILLLGCQTQKEEQKVITPAELARLDSLKAAEDARIDSLNKYNAAVAESLRVANEEARIQELKNTIKIISVTTSRPNSVGGVDVRTVWKNTSDKTIKYASFLWTPYNAVGDPVYCTIARESEKGGRVTGPVKPGETRGYREIWSAMWYNNTIKKATLDKIELEYMDGSTDTIDGLDIEHVYKKQTL